MQVWIGADWDKEKCVVAVMGGNGKVKRSSVQRTPEGVRGFVDGFEGAELHVGIESGDALWATLWRNAGATVYVFDGKKARRFAESLTASGARDDQRSAEDLLAMVQSPKHRDAANDVPSDALQALDMRLDCYDAATTDHTRYSNRLTSLLRQHHAAFARILESVDSNWVVRVLEVAPTPAAWNRLSKDEQQKALAGTRFHKREAYAKALGTDYARASEEQDKTAGEQIIAVLTMFNAARAVRDSARRNLETGLNDHECAGPLREIEGIGQVVGAGLAIALTHATDTDAGRDGASKLLGAAPVTIKSGTMGDKAPLIVMRRSASSTMRKVGHYLGTQLVRRHPWAKAAFAYHAARGKSAFSSYRRIARSFLRVLRAILRDGTTFDHERYVTALKAKGVEWAMPL